MRAHLNVDVSGPVKLLTNPHCFGMGFNPLSVYFLHQADGSPGALIYEVSNTPWNEIHRYVIPYDQVASGQEYWFDKTFHVSPFNPITQRYVTKGSLAHGLSHFNISGPPGRRSRPPDV